MKKLSKKEWIAAGISIAFIAYMFFGNTITDTFNTLNNTGAQNNQTASVNNSSGLSVQAQDLVIGTGPAVEKGMQVGVNYVLKLADGSVIQDSKLVNGGKPFNFIAGAGQLIPGWEMGILGMKVGGKRMIVIPPELGYGSQQVGPIPPNSTLVFELEVISAVKQ